MTDFTVHVMTKCSSIDYVSKAYTTHSTILDHEFADADTDMTKATHMHASHPVSCTPSLTHDPSYSRGLSTLAPTNTTHDT